MKNDKKNLWENLWGDLREGKQLPKYTNIILKYKKILPKIISIF
jgi:hypothetical protein